MDTEQTCCELDDILSLCEMGITKWILVTVALKKFSGFSSSTSPLSSRHGGGVLILSHAGKQFSFFFFFIHPDLLWIIL